MVDHAGKSRMRLCSFRLLIHFTQEQEKEPHKPKKQGRSRRWLPDNFRTTTLGQQFRTLRIRHSCFCNASSVCRAREFTNQLNGNEHIYRNPSNFYHKLPFHRSLAWNKTHLFSFSTSSTVVSSRVLALRREAMKGPMSRSIGNEMKVGIFRRDWKKVRHCVCWMPQSCWLEKQTSQSPAICDVKLHTSQVGNSTSPACSSLSSAVATAAGTCRRRRAEDDGRQVWKSRKKLRKILQI